MTNEERDLIQGFVARTAGPPSSGFASSVPSTTPAMPPIDREADAFIGELFARTPEARYRITQLAFVQEHALAEAQNQIARLQWEIQNMHQQQAPAPTASPWGGPAPQMAPQQAQQRGFFGGLFGGRAQPPAQPQGQPQYQQQPQQQPQYQQQQYAPPPQQYAPGYQPGMFQQRGSGFLGTALTTAAGVAGGMVAGHALMNLFSGGHGSSGGFGGGANMASNPFGGSESPPALNAPASPWAPEPAADPYEVGGMSKDSGNANQAAWQPAAPAQGGWQDAPSQDAGGWEDASGGSDEDNT